MKEDKRVIKELKKFQKTDAAYHKLIASMENTLIGLFGMEYLKWKADYNKKHKQ